LKKACNRLWLKARWGFPLHDLRVTVYDGKTHAVDGKDMAFVSAARKATLQAVRAANPIVLEPMVNIEVVSPERHGRPDG
jgi:elongation factor G